MAHPRVSVVLPTHNRADLLPKAIRSVLSETFTDLELILVDDCSTDNTSGVINQFAKQDARVRPFLNQANLRLPRSLNEGFAQARGEFVTWTSDDNLYHPTALQRLVETLEFSPQAGLAFASMNIVDEAGAATSVFQARPVEDQPLQPWVGACFLYRREVMEQVGEDDHEMVLAEDLDYWIRVRLEFPMVAVDEVLYDYQEHPGSLSAVYKDKVREAGARVAEKYLPQVDWLTPTNRAKTLLGLADNALALGDRG